MGKKKRKSQDPKKDWRSIIWYLFFTFFLISLTLDYVKTKRWNAN